MILSNQAECLQCGDTPWSAHRHDFRHCKCGAMAVDGGMSYLRRLGKSKDMSLSVSDKDAEGLIAAFTDDTRNDLGKLCNVARYLRDNMNINLHEEEDEDG